MAAMTSNRPEKGKEAVALAHGLQTFWAAEAVKDGGANEKHRSSAGSNSFGEAGSPACINCCAGMLMK